MGSFCLSLEQAKDIMVPLLGRAHGKEVVGGNQGFSVEKDKDDVSEGKVEDRDRPARQEGSHADKTADKPVHSHGGCFCEIPVQEVRSTEARTNECLPANQTICSKENKNENLAFGKTFSQKSYVSSQQTQSAGDEQWNEGDGTVLNKVQNEDLEEMFRNPDEDSVRIAIFNSIKELIQRETTLLVLIVMSLSTLQ
uniref:Uncharacterized protein n=1 Tax=Sphaerodactylus townsendi TaxID=933632 RepID=A0ACB8FGQ6_9SAUR